MNELNMYAAVSRGSKGLSLQDIPVAKATGFGAAADDYMERGIDLNEELVVNKPATFFFRMEGDAMNGAGVFSGDILIVDRSLKPLSGKIVVVSYDGELLVRRLRHTATSISLLSGNPAYASITVTEESSYSVWGVVTYVIHSF